MKISLDSDNTIMKNGKFDVRTALLIAGVSAAICYKPVNEDGTPVTPEQIRATETDEELIDRGLRTIMSAHTTPSEQCALVGLEFDGIPKFGCMILHNQQFISSDERSLRYTKVEMNKIISELEFNFYNYYRDSFQEILWQDNSEIFLKRAGGNEKKARAASYKIAQENARNFVNIFMPTTLKCGYYFAELQKVATYMEKTISDPYCTELEMLSKPFMIDFIRQLKDLDVLLTNNKVRELTTNEDILSKTPQDDELFFKNPKNDTLSIFAVNNPFTGLDSENEYGVNISYNFTPSYSSYAQIHRHRKNNCELKPFDNYTSENIAVIPPFIKQKKYDSFRKQYVNDMMKVYMSKQGMYLQGQLVQANLCGSVKDIIKYVGNERACINAQYETFDTYSNNMLIDLYNGLVDQKKMRLAEQVKPYIRKLRCQTGYQCANNCGYRKYDREF